MAMVKVYDDNDDDNDNNNNDTDIKPCQCQVWPKRKIQQKIPNFALKNFANK